MSDLTNKERDQIATILDRRANEIAMFKSDKKELPASVEYGLSLEIERLRHLAGRVNPPGPEGDEQ